MKVDKEVRRLVKAENAIAARARKLAAMQTEQEQARDESGAAKERLALAMLRQRGVFDLPAGQLVVLLSKLDMPTAAVHGAIITARVPSQTDEAIHEFSSAVSDTVEVTVQISRNAAEAKCDLLIRAGLKWNGKAGRWIGAVDRSRVGELRAVFGERVAIEPGAGHEATPAATPAPAEPAVAPDAEAPSEAAPEARQAGSEASPGISGGGAGEAVQDGPPADPCGQAGSAPPPVRPRVPMRPVLPPLAGH